MAKRTQAPTFQQGDIVTLAPRSDGVVSRYGDDAEWEVLAAPADAPLYLRLAGGPASATCGAFPTAATLVRR
jgi:hypothetical protein